MWSDKEVCFKINCTLFWAVWWYCTKLHSFAYFQHQKIFQSTKKINYSMLSVELTGDHAIFCCCFRIVYNCRYSLWSHPWQQPYLNQFENIYSSMHLSPCKFSIILLSVCIWFDIDGLCLKLSFISSIWLPNCGVFIFFLFCLNLILIKFYCAALGLTLAFF